MKLNITTPNNVQQAFVLLQDLTYHLNHLKELTNGQTLRFETRHGIIHVKQVNIITEVRLYPFNDITVELEKENVPSNREE